MQRSRGRSPVAPAPASYGTRAAAQKWEAANRRQVIDRAAARVGGRATDRGSRGDTCGGAFADEVDEQSHRPGDDQHGCVSVRRGIGGGLGISESSAARLLVTDGASLGALAWWSDQQAERQKREREHCGARGGAGEGLVSGESQRRGLQCQRDQSGAGGGKQDKLGHGHDGVQSCSLSTEQRSDDVDDEVHDCFEDAFCEAAQSTGLRGSQFVVTRRGFRGRGGV